MKLLRTIANWCESIHDRLVSIEDYAREACKPAEGCEVDCCEWEGAIALERKRVDALRRGSEDLVQQLAIACADRDIAREKLAAYESSQDHCLGSAESLRSKVDALELALSRMRASWESATRDREQLLAELDEMEARREDK